MISPVNPPKTKTKSSLHPAERIVGIVGGTSSFILLIIYVAQNGHL